MDIAEKVFKVSGQMYVNVMSSPINQ